MVVLLQKEVLHMLQKKLLQLLRKEFLQSLQKEFVESLQKEFLQSLQIEVLQPLQKELVQTCQSTTKLKPFSLFRKWTLNITKWYFVILWLERQRLLQPSLGPVEDHSGIAPGLSHRLIFTLSDNRLDAIWDQIKTTHMFTPTCESQKYQKLGHFWVSIQGECSKKPALFHCLEFVMIYTTNMTCYIFSS